MACRLPQASHVVPQRLPDASARPSHITHPVSQQLSVPATSATVCKMNDLAELIPRYNPVIVCGEHQTGRRLSLPGSGGRRGGSNIRAVRTW
jgi:hypothetical protein